MNRLALQHIACVQNPQEDVAAEVERFFGKSPRYEQIQFHCALAALQMGKVRLAHNATSPCCYVPVSAMQ